MLTCVEPSPYTLYNFGDRMYVKNDILIVYLSPMAVKIDEYALIYSQLLAIFVKFFFLAEV